MIACRLHVCLQEPSSIEKVAEIDEHIGCAMSGLTADAKTLIEHARADTQVGGGTMRCSDLIDWQQTRRGACLVNGAGRDTRHSSCMAWW